MGSFIARQPNGKYCRFSSVVDCPTDWNLTEQDYIDLCVEKATVEAKNILVNYVKSFDEVIERYEPSNMKKSEFKKFLKEVGYE